MKYVELGIIANDSSVNEFAQGFWEEFGTKILADGGGVSDSFHVKINVRDGMDNDCDVTPEMREMVREWNRGEF